MCPSFCCPRITSSDSISLPERLAAGAGRILGGKLLPDFITHFVNSAGYHVSRFFAARWSEDQTDSEANSYPRDKAKDFTKNVIILAPNGSGRSRHSIGCGFILLLRNIAQIGESIGRTIPHLLGGVVRLVKQKEAGAE
jgi:hypothetical protein